MNIKIRVGHGALVTLTDRNYKAAGGEASIYVNGGMVYKLYHDPKTKVLPPAKLMELSKIGNPQVVVPKNLVFDANTGDPLGYTTDWVDDASPLVKFFTRTFKDDKGVSFQMVADLVKRLQLIVADIHKASCLVVDLNELNVLVKINAALEPWMIDTDSYATPSFKATAIMDSVRDRRVSKVTNGKVHYQPDELSDWFSFGILAFWLYTNIHPFRGRHSNYPPREMARQMDDGVSVFHKGVRVPPTVNDFNLIPHRHLDWFKDVFLHNRRSAPPLPDVSAPIAVPAQIVIIKGTDKISVTEFAAYADAVTGVFYIQGITYAVTKTQVYANKKSLGTHVYRKMLLVSANDGTVISAVSSGSKVLFMDYARGASLGTMNGPDFFERNNCIYTLGSGKLIENSFSTMGTRLIHRCQEVENVSAYTAKIYEGCVIQDLLDHKYLVLPYKKGASTAKYIHELDGYRVVEAKSEKTVTVILAEKSGKYDRFILVFSKDYLGYECRHVKDVPYDTINFTVMDNGLCLLLANPTELELFSTATQFETLSDPPFDSTMRLFSTPNGVFFVNGNSVHQIRKK